MVSLSFQSNLAEGRSIMYEWFSQIFMEEPTVRNLNRFTDDPVMEAFDDLFGEEEAGQCFLASLEEWKQNKELRIQIMQDYHDLLKVPEAKFIFPYESCYREKLIDGSLGMVCGEITGQIRHLYRQSKVSLTQDELSDHIGVELSFMSQLSKYEAWQWKNDNKSLALRYRNWQIGFLNDHLLIWSQELLEKMEKQADTLFYKSIARLMKRYLREDAQTIQILNSDGDHCAI